ncbi:MAG: diacylglycerol/lipid kinase family protein, partial [Bacteroidales bacterium]
MKNIAFIINPISGGRRNSNHLEAYIAATFPSTVDYKISLHYTTSAGNATVAAQNFVANNMDVVVAVGGDGTVNEVASALVNTNVILGILPSGSGNGFARHLGIPFNVRQALMLIKEGVVQRVDYGVLNEKPFFCTAGVGFDALISDKFAQTNMRGFLAYGHHIVREFLTYKPQRYKLTIDGKTFSRKAFLITFANAAQWGYNAYIAPEASMTDGMLDVVVLSKVPFWGAPNIGLQLFVKRINRLQFVEVFKCSQITVERQKEDSVHLDG